MAKRAVLPISMEMIHALLRLPDEVEVLHVNIGNYGLNLSLVITAPDMADTDTEIGCTPPTVVATYELVDGVPRFVSLDYPRQQPAGGAE